MAVWTVHHLADWLDCSLAARKDVPMVVRTGSESVVPMAEYWAQQTVEQKAKPLAVWTVHCLADWLDCGLAAQKDVPMVEPKGYWLVVLWEGRMVGRLAMKMAEKSGEMWLTVNRSG